MEAIVSYGPITRGHEYKVLGEEQDWCLVVVRGKPTYVFKWVFYN